MAEANGWTLYEHPAFTDQLAKLEARVERRKKADPKSHAQSADAKLLAAIVKLVMEVIPADPGAKGVFYRAVVGPFASSGEANSFCSGLKAAGGQCIVQKN